MLRKRWTILFLLIAQVVILAHNIVPHHHYTDLADKQHHYHHDSKHHHSDETPLEIAFSGFIHGGETVIFTSTNVSKIVVSKDAIKSIKALPVDFKAPAEYIVVYQKHIFPPDRHQIYKTPQNGAYSLRGPPIIVA